MACPIQFYLNNVLRIRREDDPEDGISADIFGNIFHDTAEFFYLWLQEQYKTDFIRRKEKTSSSSGKTLTGNCN